MAELKKQLHIKIREKEATLTSQDFQLVGGNSDYEVVFDFDDDWANHPVKTAVFVFGDKTVEKVFDGDVCEGVAIENATICLIGVFAGDIVTTTPACVSGIKASIRDLSSEYTEAPKEDVYNQIMELLNRYINAVKGAPSGGLKGQILKKNSDKDYDYSWADDEKGDLSNYYTKTEADKKFATPEIVKEKIDEQVSPLKEEINGVEEALVEINEGGVE